MKKILQIFSLLLVAMAVNGTARASAKEFTIKVGSYNVCTSDSRAKKIKKGDLKSNQRYYCNSAGALAAMIADLDCDVIGLCEVCDSMWTQSGRIDLRDSVAAARGDNDYAWVLYPNTSSRKISYDSAIGYKKSKLKLKESGIFWMTETPDSPQNVKGAPKGTTRPAVWAKFQEISTGTVFFFFSTHLVLGSMHKDGGTEYNARNFIKVATEDFQSKYPSIVVGDFNCDTGTEAFDIMVSSQWKDSYLTLAEKNVPMSENTVAFGTCPTDDETSFYKRKIDHVLFWKFEPISYYIDRRKFPTADGSMHYPSDHCPVVVEMKYSAR